MDKFKIGDRFLFKAQAAEFQAVGTITHIDEDSVIIFWKTKYFHRDYLADESIRYNIEAFKDLLNYNSVTIVTPALEALYGPF